MRALIVQRPTSPTVSFAMFLKAGGIDDPAGPSGLAHMFEHMLVKGTKTIGTKDYANEAKLLDQIDVAMAEMQAEFDKKSDANGEKLLALNKKVQILQDVHQKVIVPEEFWRIYE